MACSTCPRDAQPSTPGTKPINKPLKKPGTEPLFLEWTNGPENPPSGCCILLLALQPWMATCSAPEPIWPEIHWFFWQHWGRCLRTLWCSPPSSETPATGPHRVCLKTGHPKSIALSSSSSLFKFVIEVYPVEANPHAQDFHHQKGCVKQNPPFNQDLRWELGYSFYTGLSSSVSSCAKHPPCRAYLAYLPVPVCAEQNHCRSLLIHLGLHHPTPPFLPPTVALIRSK